MAVLAQRANIQAKEERRWNLQDTFKGEIQMKGLGKTGNK
jgi:hypothetical protein